MKAKEVPVTRGGRRGTRRDHPLYAAGRTGEGLAASQRLPVDFGLVVRPAPACVQFRKASAGDHARCDAEKGGHLTMGSDLSARIAGLPGLRRMGDGGHAVVLPHRASPGG